MCNEIAHCTLTLTLINLFVYAAENELYTLAKVPLTSSPHFRESQLLHIIL